MAIMVIYAGIASVRSPNSVVATEVNIRKPTIINAGAVANAGIARKIGEKNREIRNSTATVMAVRPVRPPSPTPAALST